MKEFRQQNIWTVNKQYKYTFFYLYKGKIRYVDMNKKRVAVPIYEYSALQIESNVLLTTTRD